MGARWQNGKKASKTRVRRTDLLRLEFVEPLERRNLLAAVSWDGGGGNLLWNTPANWSGDVLPGAADDVTINSGSTITFSTGSVSIKSLTTDRSISMTGGSLTLTTGSSRISSNLDVNSGATLTVGASAQLQLTGSTNLSATTGGTLNLSPSVLTRSNSPTVQYQAGSLGSITSVSNFAPELYLFTNSINISNSAFTNTVHCAAEYVPQLQDNVSFTNVALAGGTLSQTVSLPVLGASMTQYQLDADLTIPSGLTLTFASQTNLFLANTRYITTNAGGALVFNSPQSITLDDYNATGFSVYGSLSINNATFQLINNRTSDIHVYSGGTINISNSTVRAKFFSIDAGSTANLTGNNFTQTEIYCPVSYVQYLVPNSSFGIVHLTGGTVSQNATLNVLGSGMTRYQLEADLAVASGVTLTFGSQTNFYVTNAHYLTVNAGGALVFNSAQSIILDDYNATGFNVYGSLSISNAMFQLINNRTSDIHVYNGGTINISNSTVRAKYFTLETGSTANLTGNNFTQADIYCPVSYVQYLVSNTSFGIVHLTGGTVTQNATLNVLGSGMTQYQLEADLAVASGVTLTFGSQTNLYVTNTHYLTINAGGALVFNSPQSITLDDYNATGFNVYGSLSATNAAFQLINNRTSDIHVYSGGTINISNSTVRAKSFSIDAGSTANLTGNNFTQAEIYCPVSYVQYLVSNTSFGIVHLTGGTVSQNATLNVLGSGMTRYQLENDLTVASGVTLTFGSQTNLYVTNAHYLTINAGGAVVFNSPQSIILDDFNATGFNVYGSLSINNATFQLINNRNSDIHAFSGGNLTISNSTVLTKFLTLDSGSTVNLTNNTFLMDFSTGGAAGTIGNNIIPSLTLGTGSTTAVAYNTIALLNVTATSGGTVRENNLAGASLGAVTVVATGSSAATFDLSNNWWGTTVRGEIEAKILHKPDQPADTRPLMTFEPWLPIAPSQQLVYIVKAWPDKTISWRTNFIDITFNRDIDLSTFTAADVTLQGPGGPYAVADIAHVGIATYRLSLSALLPVGSFDLTITPTLADAGGHLMDQNLNGTAGESSADAYAAHFSIATVPSWLILSEGSNYSLSGSGSGQTLTLSSGSATFVGDASSTHPDLNVNVSGDAIITLNSNEHLNSLTIGGTATVKMLPITGQYLRLNSLQTTGLGKLDLKKDSLIIDYSASSPIGSFAGGSYSGINGLLASGRNGGAWNGGGLMTSYANANLYALAVADASRVLSASGGTFAGQSVDGTTVLVKFTYAGDANLDGKINVDDYTRIDFNVPLATNGWYNGDFNYDGKINVDDYTVIDFNVGIQGPPILSGAGAESSGVMQNSARVFAFGPGVAWDGSSQGAADWLKQDADVLA